jgi:hypothetical protein
MGEKGDREKRREERGEIPSKAGNVVWCCGI